jgi:hypothetical protein
MVVELPVPTAVPEGKPYILHCPEGKPVSSTEPVEVEQVVCVTVPIVGALGAAAGAKSTPLKT